MCSVINDDDPLTEMEKADEKILTESDICRKCHVNKAEVILRKNDLYCSTCFLQYFNHKFRSTIGKSKEIKPKDEILIGYSSKLSSTTLLHLIKSGLNDDSPKKIRFEPSVLFIDETSLYSSSPNAKSSHESISKLKFPFYCTRLEQVLADSDTDISLFSAEEYENDDPGHSNLSKDLKDLISSRLKSQTSQDDFVAQLRSELICRCAKQLGFSKVFLGDNGTELSVRILSDIALGRGSQLGDHVQFKGKQFGVEVFRPMREIFEDEIVLYAKIENIFTADQLRDFTIQHDSSQSIISCTKHFVLSLQEEFISTVPTILKTGSKLMSGGFNSQQLTVDKTSQRKIIDEDLTLNSEETAALEERCADRELCLFCDCRKGIKDNKMSALEDIKLSKQISNSRRLVNGHISNLNEPVNGMTDLSQPGFELGCSNGSLSEEEAFRYFCYGCANLFLEMKNVDCFPARVRHRLKQLRRENHTLKTIADFLL